MSKMTKTRDEKFKLAFDSFIREDIGVNEYKLKNLTFTLHTGYGGYARFNIGASIILNTENWFIKIGSNSLQGFILPKSVFAQALYLSFAKKFK